MKKTGLIGILGVMGVACLGAEPKLNNAAQRQYGARIHVTAGTGARLDPQTQPEALLDGNCHSRMVISGAPYTITLELPFPQMVERLAFANSDYETEVAPKEMEIRLDDGAAQKVTVTCQRPVKRKPVWQEVAVGRTVRKVQVTVLSNHVVSEKVNWGGWAEVAAWTKEGLAERFAIPGLAGRTGVVVNVPPVTSGPTPTVRLPARAKPGEHPCLLMTPAEVTELRRTLGQSARGKEALAALIRLADAALEGEPEFPDPKGPPGQLKDRGDAVARQHSKLSEQCGTLGVAYALTG
jgi:hypothetical protein